MPAGGGESRTPASFYASATIPVLAAAPARAAQGSAPLARLDDMPLPGRRRQRPLALSLSHSLFLSFFAAGCAAPEPVITTASEFDRLLAEVRTFDSAATRAAAARDHYLLAERAFAEDDRETAGLECEKALELDQGCLGARALLIQLHPVAVELRQRTSCWNFEKIHTSQTLVEIDDKLSSAVRAYNAGAYADAIDYARTVIEYVKWLKPSADLDARRHQAQQMLDRIPR